MTNEQPWVQAATITARDGDEDALAVAFAEILEPTRAEPGVLTYELSRSEKDPRRFFFYEVYASRDAARMHAQTEHVRRLGERAEIQRATFDIAKLRRIG